MAEHLAQFEEPDAEEDAIVVESVAGLTGEDVLRAIGARTGPAGTDLIVIGGRSGSGKTSVAAEASRILAEAGIRHAVIEGDNLDRAFPEPWRDGIDLAERNLAAMWRNYRAVGYTRLIFTNTVSVLQLPTLTESLGTNVRSFGVLLTASDETAADRLACREIGTGLDEHIARSSAAAALLDSASSAYRIATDHRSVHDIAGEVLRASGWQAKS
ncbi:AAA family ATPase [Leifsonia shinshuensis]|nr:AAA family ATPase [Leifsonia shinshuensis]